MESGANISPSYLDILKIKREERRIKILPYLFDCMIERRGKQFCKIKKKKKMTNIIELYTWLMFANMLDHLINVVQSTSNPNK